MASLSILSIFVMACFVGTHVVRSTKPARHMPLDQISNG